MKFTYAIDDGLCFERGFGVIGIKVDRECFCSEQTVKQEEERREMALLSRLEGEDSATVRIGIEDDAAVRTVGMPEFCDGSRPVGRDVPALQEI